jgi:hypothetical protein
MFQIEHRQHVESVWALSTDKPVTIIENQMQAKRLAHMESPVESVLLEMEESTIFLTSAVPASTLTLLVQAAWQLSMQHAHLSGRVNQTW